MLEIIPSINSRTFEEVREKIRKVGPYVKWCHLDVTDGVFSKHLTWHNHIDLPLLDTKLKAEVHLMVENPEKIIDSWVVKPVKRIITHIEAMTDPELIIGKCRKAGMEIGFSINPETFWERFEPWFDKIDMVQILTVHPGPSGQEVDWPEMLSKVVHIRKFCQKCIIEVDGGINPETAKKAFKSGAGLLVSGSYIFNSDSIAGAIENLQSIKSESR